MLCLRDSGGIWRLLINGKGEIMERRASCSCGQLCIHTRDEPRLVVACSCLSCQKRTGSVFGVSSYFDNDQIMKISGQSKAYSSLSEDGRLNTRYFCPACGSTVYWYTGLFKGKTGVAVGCFADPLFPKPTAASWMRSKHEWVYFPQHWCLMQRQTPSPEYLEAFKRIQQPRKLIEPA